MTKKSRDRRVVQRLFNKIQNDNKLTKQLDDCFDDMVLYGSTAVKESNNGLTRITPEELEQLRCKAYSYLIP